MTWNEGVVRPVSLEGLGQRYRRYRADSDREGRQYHADIALENLYLVRLR